jgi:hypothetical protein
VAEVLYKISTECSRRDGDGRNGLLAWGVMEDEGTRVGLSWFF